MRKNRKKPKENGKNSILLFIPLILVVGFAAGPILDISKKVRPAQKRKTGLVRKSGVDKQKRKAQQQKSLHQEASKHTDPHRNERIEVFREWVRCAKQVANRMPNDKEIGSYVYGIANRSSIGAPLSKGRGFLIKTPTKEKVAFMTVPVLSKDNHLPFFKRLFKPGIGVMSGSFYSPKRKILFLNTQIPQSCTWKGFVVIHEVSHAYHFLSGNLYPSHSVLHDEYRAQTLGQRIMTKLGGRKYQEYLQRVMEHEWQKFEQNKRFSHTGKMWSGIKNLFGEKSKGFYEDSFRENAIWIHAIYNLIDINLSDKNPHLIKLQLLQMTYGLH